MNWYKELQNYDKHTPIIGISYNGILYSHLSDLKKELDVDFDMNDESNLIEFTFWSNYKVAFPVLDDGKWGIHEIPRSPMRITHHGKVYKA